MVGAGLPAVGVQRRDAATAGRRREGRGLEGAGAGRRLAAVIRVRVALYQYPEADLYEAAMDEGLKALVPEGATARTGAARRRGSI